MNRDPAARILRALQSARMMRAAAKAAATTSDPVLLTRGQLLAVRARKIEDTIATLAARALSPVATAQDTP